VSGGFTLRLDEITFGTGRPKGFVPYEPNARTAVRAERTIRLFSDMGQADALPLGPRTSGYRLKERHPDEYTKADFPKIGESIKRLGQARKLPFSWIGDGSSVTHEATGFETPADFLRHAADFYGRDLRSAQPVVVEIYAEAKETLPLIHRVAEERGVTVYSGQGSAGPKLAEKVAVRALDRATRGQATLILGICDFDVDGIKGVLRPHVEHVAAFLYGSTGNNEAVVAVDEGGRAIVADDLEHRSWIRASLAQGLGVVRQITTAVRVDASEIGIHERVS